MRGIIALLFVDSDKTFEQLTDRKSFFDTQETNHIGSVHDPVNIGNPREPTVLEIAKEILKLTRSSSQISHHSLPTDDPKVRRPDITRVKMLLNWEPRVEIQDALVKTQCFQKALDGLLKSSLESDSAR